MVSQPGHGYIREDNLDLPVGLQTFIMAWTKVAVKIKELFMSRRAQKAPFTSNRRH